MDDLKDFEKFLKICRKQGVTDVTYKGTTVKLGNLPTKSAEDDKEDEIQGPTDEQLAFYHLNQIEGVNQ